MDINHKAPEEQKDPGILDSAIQQILDDTITPEGLSGCCRNWVMNSSIFDEAVPCSRVKEIEEKESGASGTGTVTSARQNLGAERRERRSIAQVLRNARTIRSSDTVDGEIWKMCRTSSMNCLDLGS